jgi:hypothetical protein
MACVALVLMLALQFLLPQGGPAPRAGGLAVRRPRLIAIPPIAEYPEIQTSPVFAPDRGPGEAGSRSSPAGVLSNYAALGAASGGSVATVVLSGPGGVTRTVRRGEMVEGWRLVAVDAARVTFEKDGVRHGLVIGAPAEMIAQAAKSPPASSPPPGEP